MAQQMTHQLKAFQYKEANKDMIVNAKEDLEIKKYEISDEATERVAQEFSAIVEIEVDKFSELFDNAILSTVSQIEFEFMSLYYSSTKEENGSVLTISTELQDIESYLANIFDDECGYMYEEIANVLVLSACSKAAKYVRENVLNSLKDQNADDVFDSMIQKGVNDSIF